jgi:hypothetical protein
VLTLLFAVCEQALAELENEDRPDRRTIAAVGALHAHLGEELRRGSR